MGTLMCVVGVDHSELVSLAEKHFGNLSVGYEDGVIPLLEPCRYTGSEVSECGVRGWGDTPTGAVPLHGE